MYNVKLKDRQGNELTYTDIENIKVPTDTGNLALFKSQAEVQEKIVNISKNGTTEVTPDAGYDGLSKVTITTNVPSSGGGNVRGVSFIDYDGTIVETWALSDLASKTELPAPPTHDRLVFQQWNWTLEDIKAANAEMVVGALYTTVSGLTEFHIRVTKASGLAITCNMVGNKNWGDGTEDALTSHTYADYGDYIITCDGNTIATKVMGDTGVVKQTLLRVFIPNGVTSIGANAFNSCFALQSISIPNSVTGIGNNAFNACKTLQSISIPNGVTSIWDDVFNNCSALQSISIPNSVTSIGNGTFNACKTLQSISIPNSVTKIGEYTFNGCYALQSISIPNGVTSIGYNTFNSCFALQSISIPNSVTKIVDNAFYNCSASEYDFSKLSKVPTLGASAFKGIFSSTKILVPSVLYDTWVAATNWTTYANYIVAV